MRRKAYVLGLLAFVTVGAAAERERSASVPDDLTQYLVLKNGALFAAPSVAISDLSGAGDIEVIRKPDEIATLPTTHLVRSRFGGRFPYVVVHARREFLIVSEEDDVLVVGVRNPSRLLASRAPWLSEVDRGFDSIVLEYALPAPAERIYVQDRLNVGVILPPGVPSDAVEKQDLADRPGSTREPWWQPNLLRCVEVTAMRQYSDVRDKGRRRYDVFQLQLNLP